MPQSETPYQILLVEDTMDLAKLAQATLSRVGLDLFHAENGNEAIDYLDNQMPDLILLDLDIPGPKGWEVLEFAKHRYGEDALRVIVTTAYSDSANKLIGKLQYVSYYLVKPYKPQELIDIVTHVLNEG